MRRSRNRRRASGGPAIRSRCSGARKTAGADSETSRYVADFSPRRNRRPAGRDHSTARRSGVPPRSSSPRIAKLSPSGAQAAGVARRKERWPHRSATASSRFDFPWPFSPASTCRPEPKKTGSGERLRKRRGVISEKRKSSFRLQSHRHDDVQVAGCRSDVPLGLAHALRVLVFELEADLLGLRLVQKVEQVLRVQADRDGLAVELDVDLFIAPAQLPAAG